MYSLRPLRPLVVLAAALLLLAACGDDDGASVRDLGAEDGSESGSGSGSGSASGSGSGSGSASGSGSGSGSASAPSDAECSPVGTDLADQADTTVEIQLADFAFVPAEIEVDAGIVTFTAENIGDEPHELAFLPGGGEVPFVDGAPDEDALAEAGAFELEAFGAGQSCDATYDLAPGTYTLFCIVESADGTTHYEQGMRGTLVVG